MTRLLKFWCYMIFFFFKYYWARLFDFMRLFLFSLANNVVSVEMTVNSTRIFGGMKMRNNLESFVNALPLKKKIKITSRTQPLPICDSAPRTVLGSITTTTVPCAACRASFAAWCSASRAVHFHPLLLFHPAVSFCLSFSRHATG